ncbi:hypothetical protein EVAR_26499_1 [Eumeta japonica]|uniref:Uncharacterized protein n=1 Tax=Eumeta variegata TaxID=151549 RepID=A0A4C1V883_EUMVA|nr:hypothetical protein EVAR_26499_1 [Eumeta japonica]
MSWQHPPPGPAWSQGIAQVTPDMMNVGSFTAEQWAIIQQQNWQQWTQWQQQYAQWQSQYGEKLNLNVYPDGEKIHPLAQTIESYGDQDDQGLSYDLYEAACAFAESPCEVSKEEFSRSWIISVGGMLQQRWQAIPRKTKAKKTELKRTLIVKRKERLV